jgi:hypothetical protein
MVVLLMMDYSQFRIINATPPKMDFWFKSNQNVLLIGKHGVGKTALITDTFNRNGLIKNKNYLIFSGGTLDPWTDFIGIPKKTTLEDGSDVLDYIRPRYMNSELEAIFMDEYNRTSPKVRNALMELIQFKSINGKEFPNLKVVWAACNPHDDDLEYDVESIDPAQGDRFQIIVQLPNKPNVDFFKSTYGENGIQATTWWEGQNSAVKEMVSPRRLEYCLKYFDLGGDISEILPVTANARALKDALKRTPTLNLFLDALKSNNFNEIKSILNDENYYDEIIPTIILEERYYSTLANYLKEERISNLLLTNDKFFDWAATNYNVNARIKSILQDINSSIDGSTDFNKYKEDRLKLIFSHEKDDSTNYLVANPLATKFNLDQFCPHSDENVDRLDSIITKQNDFSTLSPTKRNSFLSNYWLKTSGYLINPTELSIEIKHKFLSFVDVVALNSPLPITEYKGLFEYVNSLLLSIINNNEFEDFIYYSQLHNYITKLKKSPSLLEKFIIQEKDMIDVGDYPINNLVKSFKLNEYGSTPVIWK